MSKYEDMCKLQTQLYLECLASNVTGAVVSWWGGDDEGHIDVSLTFRCVRQTSPEGASGEVSTCHEDVQWCFLPTEEKSVMWPAGTTEETLRSLEDRVQEWFCDLFDANGWSGDGGDGNNFGINITFDFVNNTAEYDSWESQEVTLDEGTFTLNLE